MLRPDWCRTAILQRLSSARPLRAGKPRQLLDLTSMPPLKRLIGLEEGRRLLHLSEPLDTAKISPGGEAQNVAFMLVLFVVRARRLVRAIGCLVENDLGAEAENLNRTLFEHAATVAWICMDPRGRRRRWILHDARERLAWDDKVEEKTRPEGGGSGRGERLLGPDARALLERRVAGLEAEGAKGMPKLEQICEDIGGRDLYHYLYSYWSKGFEHPLAMALERFSSGGAPAEGWVMDAYGEASQGNEPYETAVMNLHWVLETVQAVNPSAFPWKAELDEVAASLKSRYEAAS